MPDCEHCLWWQIMCRSSLYGSIHIIHIIFYHFFLIPFIITKITASWLLFTDVIRESLSAENVNLLGMCPKGPTLAETDSFHSCRVLALEILSINIPMALLQLCQLPDDGCQCELLSLQGTLGRMTTKSTC